MPQAFLAVLSSSRGSRCRADPREDLDLRPRPHCYRPHQNEVAAAAPWKNGPLLTGHFDSPVPQQVTRWFFYELCEPIEPSVVADHVGITALSDTMNLVALQMPSMMMRLS